MRKLSRSDNGVKLRIDDDDDLWTLARICREGASAGMLSHRRDSTTGTQEGGRSKQAERKPLPVEVGARRTTVDFRPVSFKDWSIRHDRKVMGTKYDVYEYECGDDDDDGGGADDGDGDGDGDDVVVDDGDGGGDDVVVDDVGDDDGC